MTESGEVILKAKVIDSFLHFSVSDSSAGVPSDKLGTIFDKSNHTEDRYFQSRALGLDLSTIKEIINFHGDQIDCSANSAQGSTFTIKLKL